jgi:signal transduction histidine kinase
MVNGGRLHRPARGSGLIGLRDRVEAAGGTFRLKSRHGEGTHLLI